MRQVVAFVRHEDVCIAQAAAPVLWALAPSSDVRGDLVALKGVAALHELLVRTLQVGHHCCERSVSCYRLTPST